MLDGTQESNECSWSLMPPSAYTGHFPPMRGYDMKRTPAVEQVICACFQRGKLCNYVQNVVTRYHTFCKEQTTATRRHQDLGSLASRCVVDGVVARTGKVLRSIHTYLVVNLQSRVVRSVQNLLREKPGKDAELK